MTDPEGRVTRYQYDALNRLTTHTDPDDRVTRFEYDPLGRLTSLKRPNNTETVQNYDLAGNLSSIKHQGPEGLIASFDYTYDQMGNRTAQVEEDGATTAYQYDPLYRLTKVTYPIDKIKKIRDTYLTPPNSVNPPPADGVNKDKSNRVMPISRTGLRLTINMTASAARHHGARSTGHRKAKITNCGMKPPTTSSTEPVCLRNMKEKGVP